MVPQVLPELRVLRVEVDLYLPPRVFDAGRKAVALWAVEGRRLRRLIKSELQERGRIGVPVAVVGVVGTGGEV